MGTEDDKKDDPNIHRLHNAITQEKWTYFDLLYTPCCVLWQDGFDVKKVNHWFVWVRTTDEKNPH